MIGIMFGVFALFLALGIPIAFSVGWATLSVNLLNPAFTCNPEYFFRTMVNGMDSYVLLAIPLFMLSSSIMAESGMSNRLFDFFAYFFGHIPSGLPIAVVVTCLFYGAICGSGPATVAAIGTMCIPLLTKLGYDRDFVTAMIAVSGGLGVIIPPSIPFITYGLATGASIGDLFIAGFAPGVLTALCLIAYIVFYFSRRDNSNLQIAHNAKLLRDKGFITILKESFFALLAPVIILGGIYGGIVSPTEAACVSVVYALLIGVLAYRAINFKNLVGCLIDTARTATPVMLILSVCIVFGRVLTILNIPQTLAAYVVNNIESKIVVLLAINIFLLFAGMVMDTVPCILILAPIMLPIVQQYGVDPIHFGIIMTVNLAIGFVTPPIGTNLFVANSLTKIPITRIAKHALPFVGMFFLALLLITYIPQVSLVNYVPDAVIYDLFYNFSDIDAVKAKYMNDKNFIDVMRKKYADADFYLGGYSVHGFRVATANKAILSPDDLKGLTFRVMQNDYHIQAWKCMGATPTPFSFSELYTALQQKTLDAQENPIELIYAQKFYEQQSHITKTNHLQQTQQWLVSQAFYTALSDADKAVLDAGIAAACEAATGYALNNEADWTKQIQDYGCTITELTEAQQQVFKDSVGPEWEAIESAVAPEVWDAYTA